MPIDEIIRPMDKAKAIVVLKIVYRTRHGDCLVECGLISEMEYRKNARDAIGHLIAALRKDR